ncbi:DegV family protein [Lachnospiraceae bacterium KM106-2]|nr:DegV family protein [Lachnospiraceae bacterium KM106-2]
MKYGIVVDSGCDITNIEDFTKCGIAFTRVPLSLQVGNKTFIDDLHLDINDFLEESYAYKGKSGSAAPSPGAWCDAYSSAEYIFVITITGTLSGSYSSACTGKNMYLETDPAKRIHVINSLSAGPYIALLAYKLKELILEDLDFDTIVEKITEYDTHTHLLFVLEHLDNLIKNGRVSKLQGGLAGILGIKMLGCSDEHGQLSVLEKCRGKSTAYDKLVATMYEKGFHGGKVVINHCNNENMATRIRDKIHETYPDCEITIMTPSGLCCFYEEKGGVMVGFES